MALKFRVGVRRGIAVVSRAGEALFSLGWQSPRDGVSKKNTGGCATLQYTTL